MNYIQKQKAYLQDAFTTKKLTFSIFYDAIMLILLFLGFQLAKFSLLRWQTPLSELNLDSLMTLTEEQAAAITVTIMAAARINSLFFPCFICSHR